MQTELPDLVTITSPPRLSSRHPGYLWAYIDQQTAEGRACGICIPIGTNINKGDRVKSEFIRFDSNLGASFLMVGDQQPATENPVVPDLPPAGWAADPHPAGPSSFRPGQYGMRGRSFRRQHLAEANTVAASLPDDFVHQLDLATRGYLYIAKRIGADETPRPDIAKSLAITVLIQYFKKSQSSPMDFDDDDMALVQ